MRNSIKAVVFGALSVMFSAGLQAEVHQHGEMAAASDAASEQVIEGTGIVKDIDLTNKKITISHEAIPAVGWSFASLFFTFLVAALPDDWHWYAIVCAFGNLGLIQLL